MPTVSVGRDCLFQALGRSYTQEEFEELCFEFGIELDDVTTEKEIIRKEKHLETEVGGEDEEEVIYKIEVAANRYDLLCLEGIARALRIFIGKEEIPIYKFREIPRESMLQINVSKATSQIRPYVVGAVLRGVSFNRANYNSFIDLQDKLHQNICRKRTRVAIGTHDLDTIDTPFSYEALIPQDITFIPLKQVKSFRADELLEFYKSDLKLKKFLHIIENSPVYPVIYDRNRTVLSLPPIINSAHSALSLRTKNVFIECTATDLTKAKIVLNTMVTMFSEYCDSKFEVEPVEVVYPDDRQFEDCTSEGIFKGKNIYPDLAVTVMDIPLSVITCPIGVTLGVAEVIPLLNKMQLHAKEKLVTGNNVITVHVPPTRSDILHPCDVMEDVAIAYGYDKIPRTKPKCIGGQQPLNVFSDKIRGEVSSAGYMEVLTWLLCSHEENFAMVKRKDDGAKAVTIENPRSSEFEVVRTSLLPGLLKTLKHNIDHRRPIKIFEVGDVVCLDGTRDVGASNNRRLAALYCNVTSGFEEILGLVMRIMQVVRKPHEPANDNFIRPSNEPEFFPNRQCYIIFKDKQIGAFGVVHPEVLEKFGIPDPCSFVEIDIQALL
ncbi:phenylalanine--tRNA ligase beta subunit, cytoplasmic [Dendrobium catenatum]|uniref:phenylalanine--tRNA ligase n=1 Tax=Dendrobium catenatum TaxID=906689 RepID=A0A2I0VBS1_9ASPA|nr:phenylalanine--tRNA ligase beta subunit, cytoplasmic [Dendrobium catenatum]PKU60864.1 putative phenylalanine--tRNA ligase beta subunit [Dendrobium catenatum]